MLIGNAVD